MHKTPPLPHCSHTFWAPTVRVQEGATPRLHTIRAPLTRAQEATVPTPQPHILGPYCTHARGCHSHASTQSGPLSHAHKRKPLPHRHQHTGPQLHTCKRVPLPRLHTIRAPLTRAQEATVPTPKPHILGPCCTRARGCHSHASTQSGPLSHVHKRPQFPRHNPTFWAPAVRGQEGATPTPPHNPGPSHTCTRGHSSHAAPTPQVHILGPYCTHVRGCHSHASTQSGPLSHAHKRKPLPHRHQHTGPLLQTCKRVPLPRLHTIRAPLTRAQEATVPTPQPHILGPCCTRARGRHSHASTQSGPLSDVHKRPQLPRRSHAAPTPQSHILGPYCTRARGCHSHASTQSVPLSHAHKRKPLPHRHQHTGPQLYACKRVPLPRLHTIRAPLTRAQEATVPTPQPHIQGPCCTRARGCHSHASTQSGPLSHVHKRPQFPRHNPTFRAPAVRVQEGATPTPPHNPGPSHTCTRGHSSHAKTPHSGPLLHTCKRVPLPRLHTIRAPLTRAQEAAAPTPQVHILGPYCTHVRGCHSHASTQSGPLSHAHKGNRSHTATQHTGPQVHTCKRVPLPRLHTIRAPLTCAQEATAPTPQPHILGPYCTRARGCHSHASTQSGPLSHVHKRPQLPRRSHATSPHSGPLLYACKRVPLPRLHTIRAPLTCAQKETAPTLPPNILDPKCTRARGCHSHASTQSGPLSHVHKRPQLPHHNPTFWAPTVRVQEGATPTPPHNPGPSHTCTRGHSSHAAPTPQPHILGPYCTRARGCHSHASTQSGPSHMRTRGNRSHTATNILDPNCTR
ncbi:mediator of DNA damage checkpoint protein 1 isoform X3 [Oreochromis niloticus]|uniref:mediator of DNA damage checkpoint protein 1 isoform X3 n=1 Tax=Oreochromis niloticus TaxID=8128 RepID=UPI000DF27298|nr:mediator of DNA damage checkpoint protein 1 isoform X3 [Oreochromis niloticus]